MLGFDFNLKDDHSNCFWNNFINIGGWLFHTSASYLWVKKYSKMTRESMDFPSLSCRQQWLTAMALMHSWMEVFFTQVIKALGKMLFILSLKLEHLLASWVETVHHLTVCSGTARLSPGGERSEVPVPAGKTTAPSNGPPRPPPLLPVLPHVSRNLQGTAANAFSCWGQEKGTLVTFQFPAGHPCWPERGWLDHQLPNWRLVFSPWLNIMGPPRDISLISVTEHFQPLQSISLIPQLGEASKVGITIFKRGGTWTQSCFSQGHPAC